MPDNQAKIKFNGVYLKKIDRYVQAVQNIHRSIPFKLRAGREADLNRVVSALWVIKQFAYVNVKAVPFSDDHTIMKYDMASLLKIRNAKQSLKILFGTLEEDAQKRHKALYSGTLEVFNQIETHLEENVDGG